MSKWLSFAAAGIAAALATPGIAAAAINAPGCPALVQWSQSFDANARTSLSPSNRLAIHTELLGPKMEQVFGKPALQWVAEDFTQANNQFRACQGEAKKAKRNPEITTLETLRVAIVQSLAGTLYHVNAATTNADNELKAVLAQPPSRDLFRVLAAIRKVRPGGNQSNLVYADLDQMRVPFAQNGRNISITVRDGPASLGERMFQAVDKPYQELMPKVIAEADAALKAPPETPEGLRMIDGVLAQTKAELGRALPPEEIAKLEQTGQTKRAQIEDAIIAKEKARIDATPSGMEGLMALQQIGMSAPVQGVSATKVNDLKTHLLQRRETVVNGVVDQQIAKLDSFKGTLDGLREMDGFQLQMARQIEGLGSAAAATKFKSAADQKLSKLGRDAFPSFRSTVTGYPDSRVGMGNLDSTMRSLQPTLARLEPDVQKQYTDIAAKKQADIMAAIKAEDAKLAAMPLAGGKFVDPDGNAGIEFRNKTRAYIIMMGQMSEVEYELDGDKVILKSPRGNQVLVKDGVWLRGLMPGLDIRRVPDNIK
jgi:hypothetical protein